MVDFTSTFFLYKQIPDGGVKIMRCRSLDTVVELPKEIHGKPVTELGAYVFSEHLRQPEEGRWTGNEEEMEGVPEVTGERLLGLYLPAGILKVGAYAFYNCWNLEHLSCHSTTLDWGAGAFTGCTGVTQFDIFVKEGEKSCLKEILTELRQTLFVSYHGKHEARLVFPEFFEESVENTPARILETHMHGCGHRYRYCFYQSEFQFGAYDALFCHVRVQEPEELVIRLAVGRLRWPYGLSADSEKNYRDYLAEHKTAAAVWAARDGDMERLRWLMGQNVYDRAETGRVIEAAGKRGDSAMTSYLMNLQDDRMADRTPGRKRFEL